MKPETISLLKFILVIIFTLAVFVIVYLFIGFTSISKKNYGVTFSRPYAEELGLNADDALTTTLDDIGVRRFRIAAYWSRLEPKEGEWHFDELDRDLAAIAKRNGKVILAIGEKLPRWPECWTPDWVKNLPQDQRRIKTLNYLEAVVQRYRSHPEIISWQVENEPHFQYGDCQATDFTFIQKETQFVRGLDSTRKISTTDSGELSWWVTLGVFVDDLGVSVYRVVRNPLFGNRNLTYWYIPPFFYARKANLLRIFGVKNIYVSEFQMEPWSNKGLTETPVDDQLSSMDDARMIANLAFAERMNVSAIDFWGVEWWIWMKEKQAHPEFVELAKKFFAAHP